MRKSFRENSITWLRLTKDGIALLFTGDNSIIYIYIYIFYIYLSVKSELLLSSSSFIYVNF